MALEQFGPGRLVSPTCAFQKGGSVVVPVCWRHDSPPSRTASACRLRWGIWASGLRYSDPPDAALQQHNDDAEQTASANVRAYCVRTMMHEWIAAAFARRSESPFFPAARFGPTTRMALA